MFQHNAASHRICCEGTGDCDPRAAREAAETLCLLLGPMVPHLAEELWANLGHKDRIADQAWPGYDASLLAGEQITIVVQVNGKHRGNLAVDRDVAEEDLKARALAHPEAAPHVAGKTPRKILIVVPGRLVNIVVEEDDPMASSRPSSR